MSPLPVFNKITSMAKECLLGKRTARNANLDDEQEKTSMVEARGGVRRK